MKVITVALLASLLVPTLSIMAQKKPQSALSKAQDYADSHHQKMTIEPRNGHWWVEMDGSEIFGTGNTQEEAADDFNHYADLLEHEPADPQHSTASFVCPEKQYCL